MRFTPSSLHVSPVYNNQAVAVSFHMYISHRYNKGSTKSCSISFHHFQMIEHISVKLLVVILDVDTTLNLGRSRGELEENLASSDGAPEVAEGLGSHILERVLESSIQVWNELDDGATVGNGTRDSLRNKHGVALREVARSFRVGSLDLGIAGTRVLKEVPGVTLWNR